MISWWMKTYPLYIGDYDDPMALPSGIQTRFVGRCTIQFGDFPIEMSISSGCPIATFDYQGGAGL